MADVVAPSNALFGKVKDLNVRRNQDWARFGASLPTAVATGLQGGDAAAAARGFYPTPAKAPNPLQVVELKKEIIDAAAKANAARRNDRMGTVAKLRAQGDLWDKIIQGAVTASGNKGQADVSATGNVISQQTELVKDLNSRLEKQIEASGADIPAVERAYASLRDLLTPEGVHDVNFQSQLFQFMRDMDPNTSKALLLKLEVASNSIDAQAGDDHQIGGMAGIMAGLEASGNAPPEVLDMAKTVMAMSNANADMALQAQTALAGKYLDKPLRSGGQGPEQVKKFIAAISEAVGAEDPAKAMEEMEKLVNGLDPEGKGGSPDTQRYADLLDSMDSEAAPANLQEARRRLIEDPEFQTWMKQNGFQDPGLALKELRRLMRTRAHEGRQNDLRLMRDRRLSEVGPETGKQKPAAAQAVAKGAEAPKPTQDGPVWVPNEAGDYFEWADGKLTKVETPEQWDQLDAMLTAAGKGGKGKEEFLLGPERFAEFERLSKEEEPAPEPEPAQPKAEPETTGDRVTERKMPSLRGLQETARYGLGNLARNPVDAIGDLGRMGVNAVRARMIGKKKPLPENEDDLATPMPREEQDEAYQAWLAGQKG